MSRAVWISPFFALATTVVLGVAGDAPACTIAVLTDGKQALLCNNEDWSNPNTRIWFVPAEAGRHGCAFVGFDNGWAQGGVNTEGLAFDWVAGFRGSALEPKRKPVQGNPSERMLRSCATLDQAIAFYEAYEEPGFEYAKILVAERSGASAVIGARDGRLQIERLARSRAFGYRGDLVTGMLSTAQVNVDWAAGMLRAARQGGRFPTQYSNVFDLKTGDIFVYRFQASDRPVRLRLADELARGAHTYDLAVLQQQMARTR
jgi:hypothetical protein